MSTETLLLIIIVAEFVLIVVFTLFFFLGRSRMDQVLNSIRNSVTALQTFGEARRDLERQTADSVRHLELVIAGTQTRGPRAKTFWKRFLPNCHLIGKYATSESAITQWSSACAFTTDWFCP